MISLCYLKELGQKCDVQAVSPMMSQMLEQAYRDGYTDALKNYAVWKNGEQLTAMGRNVKDVLAELGKEQVPVRY